MSSRPVCPPVAGRRAVALDARELSADRRSCQVSFSSETDEVRIGDRPAILVHEPGCADLSRINSVLWSHDPRTVIGKAEAVHLDAKTHRGRALVTFDDDETSLGIWRKVQSGSVTGASVGFLVDRWEAIDEGESWRSPSGRTFQGPAFVASKWRAYEFSLVACPADSSVGIGRSTGQVPRGVSMDPTMNTDNPTPSDPVAVATELERARCLEIDSLCSSWGETAGLAAELKRNGATVEAARRAVLAKLAEARPPVGTARATTSIVEDGAEKFARDAVDATLIRAGLYRGDEARRDSLDWGSFATLERMAEACLRRAGVRNYFGQGREAMIATALGKRAVGSHTSSDFPSLLSAVANKSLLAGYQETPATWRPLCKVRSAPDFKSLYSMRLGEAANLELAIDGAPMAEGSLTEASESYSLNTYAKRFSVTRKAIINDDLNALSSVPAKMGAAARRKIADVFYAELVSNSGTGPQMSEDSENLFSASHTSGSNYTAAAAAIGLDTLAAAKKLMRLQKGLAAPDDTAPTLDIQPAFFLAPATLESSVLQTLAAIVPATVATARAEWVTRLAPIIEPRLDSATNGTTAWYLVASPSQIDGAEVAFLDGREEPTMLEIAGTNILGIEWAIYLDFAVHFTDHRGWYRARGA